MKCMVIVIRLVTSAREKSDAVVGINEGQRAELEGVLLTTRKTLKTGRKGREGTRDMQASSRPSDRNKEGGGHGDKGGAPLGWRGSGGIEGHVDMVQFN